MAEVPVWLGVLFASIGALGTGVGITVAVSHGLEARISDAVQLALNAPDGSIQRLIRLEQKLENGINRRLDGIEQSTATAATERTHIRESLARLETEQKWRAALGAARDHHPDEPLPRREGGGDDGAQG